MAIVFIIISSLQKKDKFQNSVVETDALNWMKLIWFLESVIKIPSAMKRIQKGENYYFYQDEKRPQNVSKYFLTVFLTDFQGNLFISWKMEVTYEPFCKVFDVIVSKIIMFRFSQNTNCKTSKRCGLQTFLILVKRSKPLSVTLHKVARQC